jgi:hypothetical protein
VLIYCCITVVGKPDTIIAKSENILLCIFISVHIRYVKNNQMKGVEFKWIYILCHVTFLLCLCLEFHHMLLGNEIKKDETGGACRTHGRDEEKPLGRPRRRWEYNIRADLRDMVGKQWNGIHLA